MICNAGGCVFQNGNNEMAVMLYSEAMKYAPVHETLWEGESMAIAAANRWKCLESLIPFN